jgi:16S rRNA (adenine1518-N6/adenine1519-N6)-dimethyltransferase
MGQRLGQHFLKNSHYAEVLTRETKITSDDTVLEIGPGEGVLTRELLKTAKTVVVVEKDEALAEGLYATFSNEVAAGKLKVITADIRDIEPEKIGLSPGSYALAANIPYYITGELLRKFLEANAQPRTIAFLMQKEVAQRILSEKESILSISVKVYGEPRIAAKVTKGNFNPPPKVDSAILVVDNISKKSFTGISEEKFFEVVRTGFASKRKLLAGNLSSKFGKEKVSSAFSKCGIDPKARAETVHVEKWLQIAKEF